MTASLLLILAALPAQAPVPAPAPAAALHSGFPEQDLLSYEVYLKADPNGGDLSGSCRYRIAAVEALTSVRFHAVDSGAWALSFHDEAGAALAFDRDPAGVVVALGRTVAAGEEFGLHAAFSGTPPDGLYRVDNRYGGAVVYTDHFSARARGWLPCEDHPSDRAAFEVLLEHPAGTTSIGSGDWGEAAAPPPAGCPCPAPGAGDGWVLSGGRTASDLPTYQLAFSIGPYARLEEGGDARLVPHYVWSKDRTRARRGLKHHAAWMAQMEQVFGPYPYSKYCVVQVPTRWGGMENAGNTWIMESLFDSRGAGVGTLAHEFAHMWFGDGVGYAEWWDSWLSEGFASYFGPWLHAAHGGGPPMAREMDGIRRAWLRSSSGRRRPIRWMDFGKPDDFFGSSSINTYQKGAWVLHMLRGELGDEAFFGGIAGYYREHVGEALSTADLVASLEASSGAELDGFFEQWLDRPGCPELELIWGETGLEVRQVQSQGLYRFWLRLRWTDAAGKQRSERFRIEAERSHLELGGDYRSPVVDPEVELLYRKV